MAVEFFDQAEADQLIAMEKYRADGKVWEYPGLGGSICIPLHSLDRRESFTLDVTRGRINLLKGTYQSRARQVIVLVRLDFEGPPHRNPDGAEVPCPHLHIYREGFGDKWAVPAPMAYFSSFSDMYKALEDFMKYCRVIDPPDIRQGLFT